jgi:hypothetical protein
MTDRRKGRVERRMEGDTDRAARLYSAGDGGWRMSSWGAERISEERILAEWGWGKALSHSYVSSSSALSENHYIYSY